MLSFCDTFVIKCKNADLNKDQKSLDYLSIRKLQLVDRVMFFKYFNIL